ncbi:MAG: deoxyribonuclease IV [Vulcanimicrobiaceae bacterium]
MRFGVHAGIEGGFEAAVAYARRVGCTTMQVFSGNPKTYRAPNPDPAVLERFRTLRAESDLEPAAFHTSYLINLASADPKIAANSLRLVRNDLALAAKAGIAYVNTHLGSYGSRDRAEGFAAVVAALERALGEIAPGVSLVLENSAGAGNLCGGTLEELGELVRALDHPQLGICLDTAHAWAAGYRIDDRESVGRFLEEVERTIALARVRMFHFNDTQVELGGHRDRHWHIGEGLIGREGFRAFASEPALANRIAILETPGEEADDLRNLETVRALAA